MKPMIPPPIVITIRQAAPELRPTMDAEVLKIAALMGALMGVFLATKLLQPPCWALSDTVLLVPPIVTLLALITDGSSPRTAAKAALIATIFAAASCTLATAFANRL